MFPFALSLLLSFVQSECNNGIELYWGGVFEKNYATAYATSDGYAGTHTPEFRGSFVAKIGGMHNFKLYSATYGTSVAFTSKTEFIFENVSRGTQSHTWYWETKLFKDFRYSMRFHTTTHYYWVRFSIAVEFEDRPMADLNGDLIGTCEQNGCRDLALTREHSACQPPPSASPPRSRTPPLTLTLRASQTPPPATTPVRTASPPKSASPAPAPSRSPTESATPLKTLTASPPASASPVPTLSFSPTASVSATPTPSDSEAQTPSASPTVSRVSVTAASKADAGKTERLEMVVGFSVAGIVVLVVVALLVIFALKRECCKREWGNIPEQSFSEVPVVPSG
jgi:hypothetical protein